MINWTIIKVKIIELSQSKWKASKVLALLIYVVCRLQKYKLKTISFLYSMTRIDELMRRSEGIYYFRRFIPIMERFYEYRRLDSTHWATDRIKHRLQWREDSCRDLSKYINPHDAQAKMKIPFRTDFSEVATAWTTTKMSNTVTMTTENPKSTSNITKVLKMTTTSLMNDD